VGTDLNELFGSLVLPLGRPAGGSLSAIAIPGTYGHRLAKDASGSPCLLLRQPSSASSTPPIRLQNLRVSYGVACAITHPDGSEEEGTFTIIRCTSAAPSLFPHFLRIASPVIAALGAKPTAAAVRGAISGLVALFQALATPARKSVQGLWAELLIIRRATDPATVVSAWRGVPNGRVDFVGGAQRIEVKSSSRRLRAHHFSLEQLTPPRPARLIVASIFAEPVGHGLSLQRLADDVRTALARDPALLTRFDSIFYATLGAGWSDAMEECFDFELAAESLQFFDSACIPAINGPLPQAVRDVHFTSDVSAVPPLARERLIAAGGLFAAVVPSAQPR
jgi:hypothetical protein